MFRRRRKLKYALLNRFTVRQLNEIAIRYNIRLSCNMTKHDKINKIALFLSFEEIVKLARRFKIKHKDIIEELDRLKAELKAKRAKVKYSKHFNEIVDALEEFVPQPVRDEEDLEKQLYQYLRAKFPRFPIDRQVKIGLYRLDLQVGPCGIELKIPKSVVDMQRLIGQIEDYRELIDNVIVLILDVGRVYNLSDYVSKLEALGATPIIVKGKLKR